jgi:hypothetical protein
VPLENGCVIVNTEQLNRIHGIETHEMPTPDRGNRQVAVIHLESGVITDAAMAYAAEQGLVFATDPTSLGLHHRRQYRRKRRRQDRRSLGHGHRQPVVFHDRHARWAIVHGPAAGPQPAAHPARRPDLF